MPRDLQGVLRALCMGCLALLLALIVVDWVAVTSEDGDALMGDLRLAVALIGLVAGVAAILLRRRARR